MVAILLAGIVAYRVLPLSALPEVDYPTIQVVTLYPGREPRRRHLLDHRAARAAVRADAGTHPDVVDELRRRVGHHAAVQPRARSRRRRAAGAGGDQRRGQPAAADLPTPPLYNKVNPADTPIMTLAVTSKSMPLPQVQNLVDTRLAQKISQLPGVGLVSLSGGQRPAVRVRANPKALAAYNLGLEELRTAIANANVNQAKGSFDGPTRASTIDANDQLRSADEYRSLVIAYKNGAPIRLSDVADVIDGAENLHLAAWANTSPGHHRQRPAPARRERDRRRRPHQGAAAGAAGDAARRRWK